MTQPSINRLGGQVLAITGTLSRLGTRDEVVASLALEGAVVTSSITQAVTALVVGDRPGGGKLAKARQLGVPVLTESNLLRLLDPLSS